VGEREGEKMFSQLLCTTDRKAGKYLPCRDGNDQIRTDELLC